MPSIDLDAPLRDDLTTLNLDFPDEELEALRAVALADGYLSIGELMREITRNAIRRLKAEPILAEQRHDLLAYAVWMVGNMDTAEDKAAWWKDNRDTWELAGLTMQALADDGVEIGAGRERFIASLKERAAK